MQPSPSQKPCSIRRSKIAQAGSVLVWILIAVALFGALSYAMLRDGSTGTAARTMSDAQARLAAGEIMDTMRIRAEAYRRLRIKGCAADEIHMGTGHLPDALSPKSDKSCHIESPEGGGLNPPQLAQNFQEPSIIQKFAYRGPYLVQSQPANAPYVIGLGKDDAPDYQIHYNWILPEICRAYNKMIGIQDIPFDIDTIIGDDAEELRGKSTACRMKNDGASDNTHTQIYYVYHVN
ncbi:MAG: hypothetical protein WC989_06210 [Micavibrio sp.]